ncbi:MAG: RES family NAD+ phosphorylase [Prolixibacteraceae bacterium]|nr:RES family NAD+ phosphorylase [Prolixibacteraceae bacterium]
MADFEKAYKAVIANEGGSDHHSNNNDEDKILLCSNCFHDEGLKLDASVIGLQDNQKCPNCNSESGHKLTKSLVQQLCYRFFVIGTIQKFEYGGCPLIQFNEQHFNQSDIDVSPWLTEDVYLIEKPGEIGLFYYGPRFWMFGEVEPLKSLQDEAERNQIIEKILTTFPTRELSKKEHFYRLRKNPKISHNISEYDTAPDEYLGENRFDNIGFPVLYGSPDLELCIHECRATVEDNLFVGKLVPAYPLKVIDLSALIEEDATEFESLDIAIHFLFLAGKHSYNICRQIALKAKEKGFDGIIYPSYFSFIRTGAIPFDTIYGMSIRRIPQLRNYAQSQSIPNLALFGRPVKDQKVTVDCINKIVINRVSYDTTFGPAYHKANEEEVSNKQQDCKA